MHCALRCLVAVGIGAVVSCGPMDPPPPGVEGDACLDQSGDTRIPNRPCADGFACIIVRFGETVSDPGDYLCHRLCEQTADCGDGGRCATRTRDAGQLTRVCVGTGTQPLGATCGPEQDCAPGLVCLNRPGVTGMEPLCTTPCEVSSPHADERRCPDGFLCSPEVLGTWGSCLPACDLADLASCPSNRGCNRWSGGLPPTGDVGICIGVSRSCVGDGMFDRCESPDYCEFVEGEELCVLPIMAEPYYEEPEPAVD